MTPYVQTKIRTRNCLCQTIHQNQQEWIDACHEATEAINKAKTESWKDLLQDAMSKSDGLNMWKVIQGLYVIKKMTAGPDIISLSFLKSLGPLALQELQSIFNSSFSLLIAHTSGRLT